MEIGRSAPDAPGVRWTSQYHREVALLRDIGRSGCMPSPPCREADRRHALKLAVDRVHCCAGTAYLAPYEGGTVGVAAGELARGLMP